MKKKKKKKKKEKKKKKKRRRRKKKKKEEEKEKEEEQEVVEEEEEEEEEDNPNFVILFRPLLSKYHLTALVLHSYHVIPASNHTYRLPIFITWLLLWNKITSLSISIITPV